MVLEDAKVEAAVEEIERVEEETEEKVEDLKVEALLEEETRRRQGGVEPTTKLGRLNRPGTSLESVQ